jgi:hypothetical protein
VALFASAEYLALSDNSSVVSGQGGVRAVQIRVIYSSNPRREARSNKTTATMRAARH